MAAQESESRYDVPGRARVTGEQWSTCVVTLRRGYMSGAFVATTEGAEPEEIGRSPAFRLRRGSSSPTETGETTGYLDAFGAELEASGWERIQDGSADAQSPRFRRRMTSLHHRISAYMPEADTEAFPWTHSGGDEEAEPVAEIWADHLDPVDELAEPPAGPAVYEPATVESPPVADAQIAPPATEIRKQPEQRLDAGRIEAERVEAERVEAERLEAERLETARLEEERLEAERLEARRLERERLEAERIEAERIEAERLEAQRVEAERLEAQRLEAERLEAERLEAERLETERLEAERIETERIEAERLEAERLKPNDWKPNGSRPNGSKQNGSKQNGSKQNGSRPNGSRLNGSRQNSSRQNSSRQNGLKPNGSKPSAATRSRTSARHPRWPTGSARTPGRPPRLWSTSGRCCFSSRPRTDSVARGARDSRGPTADPVSDLRVDTITR